jgi:hypothetical protein
MSRVETMPTKIPVIFCIDAEPDPFLVNRANPEPWLGYEGTHRYFAKMRPLIEEATGSSVHYTWYFRMDPQIAESYGSPTWVADRYTDYIKEIERQKDDLGAHSHMYRWNEKRQTWIDDLGNQDWVNVCTETSIEAFAKAFGQPCRNHRCGNYWINTATVNLMETLGIHYEMTVEPGLPGNREGSLPREFVTGSFPDFCRVPREPYEPSYDDCLQPSTRGGRTIKMIPITSSSLNLGFHLRARWHRLRLNGFRYRWQNTPLAMWKNWKAPNTFDRLLDRAIPPQNHPYLAFGIRSCMGIGRAFDSIDHALRTLMAHPARKRFVFCSPSEALKILKGSGA